MALVAVSTHIRRPDLQAIIQRSVAVYDQDWTASPDYDYFERDRTAEGTKTYDVRMVLGSPYYRLVEINGQPLSPADRQREQQKLDDAVARRRSESQSQRARRLAQYEKDRKRDHLLIAQLTAAFDFKLRAEQRIDGHDTYEFQATPRPGYQPPNVEAQALKGMAGRLWIEKQTYHWVKVEASVIHPVSIEGFLARVEPGTRFELENIPVAPGVWLAKHFSMASRSKILFLFAHRTQEDDTYFGYRPASAAK
ncbi:MAG TPA: hypothetical protein VMT32_00600 [Bryobacteraceae bacterium]|nr:hypothetical protein [Bryobacteraceae bacterium]